MSGSSGFPVNPGGNRLEGSSKTSGADKSDGWYFPVVQFAANGANQLFAHRNAIGLLLVALLVLAILVNPTWFFLPAIDYSKLHDTILVLNTPERVKKILLFFVDYNIFLVLCALFGAGVGSSEILSRYRDEPFLAISSPPGRRYLAVNGGISLAAFYLLHHFGDAMFPGLSADPLLMSIIAGFGAMVVMRSKVFSFKTESGESYAIGPDAVLSIFLSSVDRQIDRYRASRRQSLVYDETQDVDNPEAAPDFFRAFLVSYQNLSNDEKGDIDEEVRKIFAQPLSPRLKFMTAAFGFLNIMGESNFKALVLQLKKYQKLIPVPEVPTNAINPPEVGAPLTETSDALSPSLIAAAAAAAQVESAAVDNGGPETIPGNAQDRVEPISATEAQDSSTVRIKSAADPAADKRVGETPLQPVTDINNSKKDESGDSSDAEPEKPADQNSDSE